MKNIAKNSSLVENIPHQVFYDDKCSLCSKEINHYRKLQTRHPINWIPIYEDNEIFQQYGFSKQELLERLHVVRGDGVVVTGASAFATIWHSIKIYRPLGTMVYKLHLIPLLEFFYKRFVKWRSQNIICEV